MGENMKAKKKAKLDLVDDDTLVVGVDVGKRNHYCRFINVIGYEICKGFSFSNNRDGMEKIISKIEEAKITKSDINDYYFTADLTSETTITINGKPKKVNAISVYIPEPIIKDQEVIWREKGIVYSFEKESNEWLNIIIGFLPWLLIIAVVVII